MKVMRKIIQIDEERCDGCGLCVPSCAEGAITVEDGIARVIEDKLCDGLGACMGECPNNALKITEREADEFDEQAVEKHLAHQPESAAEETPSMPCGCPSSHMQILQPLTPCQAANQPTQLSDQQSALTHWPVKIKLVPPTAPFLKGADLLIVADCCAVALPTLHAQLLAGKAVMIGCPKFDDAESYIQKFQEIFTMAGIKRITVAMMEVPCCQGLQKIVESALKASQQEIPYETITITTRGQILNKAN